MCLSEGELYIVFPNEAIQKSKKEGKEYIGTLFENGDSFKQLLTRSRYLLYKSHS